MINPDDSIAVKDMLAAASPLIKALVDTFVKPKLNSFKNKFSKAENNYFIPTEEHFKEYYHRTYKKLTIVNTLVFNNSQRFIKDIYIPLNLTSINNPKFKQKVDSFPEKLVHEYDNILITDTAGMGKSTLMKRIFIDIIDKNIGIPIIVELRRLTKNKSLISEIQEQLNSLTKDFDSKLLLELISDGGFIIILDGYDEISLKDRDIVTKDIQDFISKATNNSYFITSRPEKALTSFGNFQEFKIDPLNRKEAFELLRKYDNQGHISSLLIKKLQEQELSNIEEFLTNPLLVSLLFTAFEHKQAIPFKKYLFYRQVYDANFESHDLTKGESYTHDKYSNLEIDDFHRIMRHLGFNCFKLQKIEFGKDELLKLIRQSRDFCAGLKFNESDFLQDILRTVPLFTQDGNYYRWAHKSLQEYFAAQFIYLDSKEKQNIILQKLSNNTNIETFINVLDLYYDMDYKTFRNVIEYELLSDYKKYFESSYIKVNPSINQDSIIERKEILFLVDSFLFEANNKNKAERFMGSELHEMIQKNQENYNGDKRINGSLTSLPLSENIFSLSRKSSKISLLSLLLKKKNQIVKPNKSFIDLKNSKLKINYKFNNEYEMKIINDDLNSPFNSLENFEGVTLLIKATYNNRAVINSKIALKYLKEIKLNLKKESENDFLIDGI